MPQRTETRTVRLEIASPEDAAELTVVAALAFFDDRRWMPEETRDAIVADDDPSKGPPHTSFRWNRHIIEEVNGQRKDGYSAYYKILLGDGHIVGGLFAVARPDLGTGEWRCEGIYVDPDYQNRGIGQEAIRAMYRLHADAIRWSLDTPDYAVGTHRFYERMGFTHFATSDGDPSVPFAFYDFENTLPQEKRLQL